MAEKTYTGREESRGMGGEGGRGSTQEVGGGGRSSQIETRSQYKCQECGQSFESRDKLDSHNKSAHR